MEQLAKSNCARGARVIVEKPFGHNLASAQELNKVLLGVFDEADIFRIDHYLGKRPLPRAKLKTAVRCVRPWADNNLKLLSE